MAYILGLQLSITMKISRELNIKNVNIMVRAKSHGIEP